MKEEGLGVAASPPLMQGFAPEPPAESRPDGAIANARREPSERTPTTDEIVTQCRRWAAHFEGDCPGFWFDRAGDEMERLTRERDDGRERIWAAAHGAFDGDLQLTGEAVGDPAQAINELGVQLSMARAERDRWYEAHEQLVEVRRADLRNLTQRIVDYLDFLEANGRTLIGGGGEWLAQLKATLAPPPTERLDRLIEALIDDLIDTPDSEIVAELIADGHDPEQVVIDCRRVLSRAVAQSKENSLPEAPSATPPGPNYPPYTAPRVA